VEADLQSLLDFMREQNVRQAAHFPAVKCDKVLCFMGTTALAGSYASLGVLPLVSLEPAAASKELRVRLRGALPRPPAKGECVTVHVTRVEQYQGYQVKTRGLASPELASALYEASGDGLTVKGSQIFTVHHSPYTMKFFEQIPFDEVQQMVGGVRYALVGVGEQANISPRWIWHSDVKLGKLVQYHGDGLALKTYMNLKLNRQSTRLVLDLDDWSGYVMRGTIDEFQPHQHPEAYEKICQGFTAGNWGKPSRVFRYVVDGWERIAPAAPAVR
jgi:hypothetical protein